MAAASTMQENKFPTLDRLGVQLSADEKIDAVDIASQWFASFAQSLESANSQNVHDLLLPNAFWRDLLALTWDFRTMYAGDILTFLKDRLPGAKISKVSLNAQSVHLVQPMPDMTWIQASFTFDTELGVCSGIVRLMPTSSGAWKAYTVFTNLEDLRGHPEMVGKRREQYANPGVWLNKRRKEVECEGEDEQPAVLIIGAGQSGLEGAARLKYLGIKSLIVEREDRVGHGWRTRYEAMCLHDTVWYDQMPYLPFPSTWPVFTPGPKLADWLEHYADILELNVWTSTKILKFVQHPETHHWTVTLQRGDGSVRDLSVRYVVAAIGNVGGKVVIPDIPGKSDFRGEALHTTAYRTARNYIGKRVAVIGAANSAHDVCRDLYDHGVDVTMIQRSSTHIISVKGLQTIFGRLYNEDTDPNVGDRDTASLPRRASKELTQRAISYIGQTVDKDLLDGLKKVGFRTNKGDEDCGPAFQVFNRLGGFYLEVGGSQLVAEGKIKVKSDSQISRFTETGLEFEDGSTLKADVVIYATGFHMVHDTLRELLGEELGDKLKPIWGLDAEGELKSCYRGTGIPHFWTMLGNLAMCRFHSKHLALQIKAMEEGLWDGQRYSLED